MFSYIWPIGLVVLSNTLYHISAKSSPEEMNPFASLSITYLVGAMVSLGLYFFLNRGGSLIGEYQKLNWSPFVLGLTVVGLEAGYLYAYKAGWPVSMAQIVQSSILAVFLLIAGTLIYKEALTWNKLVGVAICLVGLAILNWK